MLLFYTGASLPSHRISANLSLHFRPAITAFLPSNQCIFPELLPDTCWTFNTSKSIPITIYHISFHSDCFHPTPAHFCQATIFAPRNTHFSTEISLHFCQVPITINYIIQVNFSLCLLYSLLTAISSIFLSAQGSVAEPPHFHQASKFPLSFQHFPAEPFPLSLRKYFKNKFSFIYLI